MKKILFLLISCLVFGACVDNHGAKTPAGKVFVKFAAGKTIKEKAKYILNADKMLPYMEDRYKNRTDIRIRDYEIIEEVDKESYTVLKIKVQDRLYWAWLKKDIDGKYKVDWQNWTRYTPHTLGEFIANNEKLEIYANVDRSVSPIISQLIADYFVFRIASADIGQGILNEKEDGYTVNEVILGLCSKKQKNCKEFYKKLAKHNINEGSPATLQLEPAPKDLKNPLFSFALVTKVEPSWLCDL